MFCIVPTPDAHIYCTHLIFESNLMPQIFSCTRALKFQQNKNVKIYSVIMPKARVLYSKNKHKNSLFNIPFTSIYFHIVNSFYVSPVQK